MRYHYKMPADTTQIGGETYECNHPIYSRGTLFKKDMSGLVIIQQRWNPDKKIAWWSEVDPWLVTEIFKATDFKWLFAKFAAPAVDDLYPTITVRQAMHYLKIKPLERACWETVFDRKPI